MDYTVSIESRCLGKDRCTPWYSSPKVESYNLVGFPDRMGMAYTPWWFPMNYGCENYVEASIVRSTNLRWCPGQQGSIQVVVVSIKHKAKIGCYVKLEDFLGDPYITTVGSDTQVLFVDCCQRCCFGGK